MLKAILTACVPAALCACVCVDYGRAEQVLSFRIVQAPPHGAVSVTSTIRDGVTNLAPSNGVYLVSLPHAGWGNIKLFGLIPVSGVPHPEKSEAVIIRTSDEATTISIEDLRRSPQEADGTFTVELK